MKLIFRTLILLFLSVVFFIVYLSYIGIETKKFNNEIVKKIKKIDNNFELELKEIKILLDPFKFRLHAKTLGTKLKNRDKIIEIENIKTQIPLRSLFKEKFLIENLEISSKLLEVKDLISFGRALYNNPEFYILDKIVKKGFLIADVKLNFDTEGNIKDDFQINGFIKDTKIKILKKYEAKNINFVFSYNRNFLNIEDTKLFLNNSSLSSKNLSFKKINDQFLISGDVEAGNSNTDNKIFYSFLKSYFPKVDIVELKFNSKNNFKVNMDNKFRFSNFKLKSNVYLEHLSVVNKFELKSFFPKLNENIRLENQDIQIDFQNDKLLINGSGEIFLQNKKDELTYKIDKKKNILNFDSSLKLFENPFIIKFLDYEKKSNNNLIISIKGKKKLKDQTEFFSISLQEKANKIIIENLLMSNELKILNLKKAKVRYLDKNDLQNDYNITSNNNNYFLSGLFFNADSLLRTIMNDETETNIIKKKFNLDVKIDKLFFDKTYNLSNLKGNLSFNNQKILNGNLVGNFSNNKKLNLTIKTSGNEKITTLYLDKAEVLVNRYEFVKGFEEGILDFYSTKKNNESLSTLKIYDFKLKELPVLTKLLTLASLQGVADLLSGEGIRFNEFEMNFKNKGSLMTIDEIYAIGPAISILMNGYVEKEKLISLRGTLVPATTLNKVIGSLPLIGNILVGKKTGEGVFGVSFKIKGPPKNLQTTVNPIKTLTPRFITRTLEKIKKN
jgi:hypothetical protein